MPPQASPPVDRRSQRWFWIALLNFVLAAVMGTLLRYAFVEELSFMAYRKVQHGHSHVAMLGWIYLGLYALILHVFLPAERRRAPFYRWLFAGTQLTVVGMLVAFPWQGYAFWSILFSTLHVIASYLLAWRLWRDLRETYSRRAWSLRWIKAALLLMLLSTLALWFLPVTIVLDPSKGTWYYMTIQFYLHFQLNGWFLFAALGLFFRWCEGNDLVFPAATMHRFFWLLLASTLPTYALALRWANPLEWLFYVNGLGVLIQLAALLVFWQMLRPKFGFLRSQLSPWGQRLMTVALISFAAKILMQSVLVLPFVAEAAYTIRNYVIGFVHLITLGIMAHFLLGLALETGLLSRRLPAVKWGLGLFVVGFVLSEAILFIQGSMFWAHLGFLPTYYLSLTLVSVTMLVGVLVVLLHQTWQIAPKN